MALQVHGGCDVRGGYTAPVVFKAAYGTDYLLMECTTELDCSECGNIGRQYESIQEFDEEAVEYVDEHEGTGESELMHTECGGSLIELNSFVGV